MQSGELPIVERLKRDRKAILVRVLVRDVGERRARLGQHPPRSGRASVTEVALSTAEATWRTREGGVSWRVLLAIGAIAAGGATEANAQVVRVTDYGAEPGSRRNAVAAVGRALEACRGLERPVLVFPRGRYDFWPQHAVEKVYFESNTTAVNPKRLAILIEGFAGLTVDGGGSTFVFHDRMQPFTVDRSTGVTIRDLSIDWDIPLSAEAVVEAATEEYLDLRIDDRQFPYVIEKRPARLRRGGLEERLVGRDGVRRPDAPGRSRDRRRGLPGPGMQGATGPRPSPRGA